MSAQGNEPAAAAGSHSDVVPVRLVDNLPGLVYRCRADEQQTMLFVSRGCQALTGYSAEDLLHNSRIAYRSLIHPDDQPAVLLEIEAAVAEKRPFRCIYRLKTSGSEEQWVLEKGEAVYDEAGQAVALEGFITDHSERMVTFQLLEQRVADRTRKLTALYEILQAAGGDDEPPETLARILALVLKAVKGDASFIHLLAEDNDRLQLAAQIGLPDEALAALNDLELSAENFAGQIVRQQQPLQLPTSSDRHNLQSLHTFLPEALYLGVPLTANERPLGVLSVLHQVPQQAGTVDEIDLLTSAGEQIAIILENAHLRQQARQLLLLTERNRLARELHDSVTQSLYSVTLFAEAGRRMAAAQNYEQAAGYLADAGETARQALKEMRLLVHRLRPSILAREGLVRAIQQRLNAVEGRAGIKHYFISSGDMQLPAALEEALYHITQEALNNSLKHAQASEIIVRLEQMGEEISLQINDNGLGFDVPAALESGGLGLTSMTERAEALGGRLECRAEAGQGTAIEVRLPL